MSLTLTKPTGADMAPAKSAPRAKVRTLYNALPIVASALGAKFGLQVIVSGNEMKTDGKRIYVPAFDPEDPELRELAFGVIAHEAYVHVRRTDFGVYEEAARGVLPPGRTEAQRVMRKRLLNVFDDLSGEYALFQEYPGTRKTINAVLNYLLVRGMMSAVSKDEHPAKALFGYCLLRGRASVLDQKLLAGVADESEVVVSGMFPAGAMVRLNALISEARYLETTRDCLNHADLVLDMLEEEEEKARQQPPQQSQQGQQGDDQDQDDQQQQGGSGSGSGSDEDDDADGSGGGDTDDDQQGSDTSKGSTSKDAGDGDEDGEDEHASSGGGSDADGEDGDEEDDQDTDGAASDSDGDGDTGDGSDQDDGQDGSEDSKSGGSSCDMDGDDEGDGSDAGGQDDADGEDESGGSGESSSGSEQGGAYDPKGADAIAEALSASEDEAGSEDLFHQAAQELSKNAAKAPITSRVPAMAQPQTVEGNPLLGQGIVSRVRTTSGRVRAQLQGLVQASQREDEVTRRRGRAVDGRKIARVAMGDTRVFTQRTDKIAPNAAIHILVDRSGSMVAQVAAGGAGQVRNRLDVAIDSAVALATALEAIAGVNPAITAFPAARSDYETDPHRAIGVLPLLKHGQKVRQVIGNFAIRPNGGTPLAEAMWYAAAQLVNTTKEERKLLLVVTDGEPNNAPQVLDMVQRCQASGIELIGIGIQIDRVRELFPTAVVIQDISQLRTALFEITRKALTAAA
ncbi:VWA domain-containing protein [Azospirillum sp. SYSU D00513]|uniref:VWA domain-containing protein n=1 Tax=Azospirillum sp. SYSU D00513 TaxID=2812561 RepID=UPI001A96C562|nr:VWA domain-containing protein [Azospirillum sp. SYSU D00513]